MTIVYMSWAVLMLAWVVQFVAWRRAVVRCEQLELQVEKLQAVASIRRHPAIRNRSLPEWAQEMEGGDDD